MTHNAAPALTAPEPSALSAGQSRMGEDEPIGPRAPEADGPGGGGVPNWDPDHAFTDLGLAPGADHPGRTPVAVLHDRVPWMGWEAGSTSTVSSWRSGMRNPASRAC